MCGAWERVRPPPVDGKPSGKAKREDFAGGGLFVKLWGRSPADQKAAPDVARNDRVVSDPPVLSIVDRLGGCCFRFRSH